MCRSPSFAPVDSVDSNRTTSEIEADSVIRETDNTLYFSGSVEMKLPGQTLQADTITFDEKTGTTDASGRVVFNNSDYRIQAEQVSLNEGDQSANFSSPQYQLNNQHGRGSASQILQLDASSSRFLDMFYTTCDPGDRSWHITSPELDIDQERGLGSAWHATIHLRDIPVFYLPYLMFPIDERRMSGLLTPSFGYSRSKGSTLVLPVYWNIAPNYDATITPSWFSERGLQLNTENRYLFSANSGQIDFSYLNDRSTNSARRFGRWHHSATPATRVSVDLLLQEVSDVDFFHEFNDFGIDETTKHLERHLKINHVGNDWNTTLLWQDYQTIDSTTRDQARPYRRLPSLRLASHYPRLGNGLSFNGNNELVQFDRDNSITGTRIHLLPSIDWLATDSWYFVKPKLEYALTQYSLDNNSLGDDTISRQIPIFSIDSGLFFDRQMNVAGDWTQTLEPRLYFLNTGYEEQSHIPDFDSANLTESYGNFFRSNRFSGSDRIGDANQLALGIGTRIFDNKDGSELMHAKIGQVHYFEDRRVSLSNEIETSQKSNVIAEIDLRPAESTSIKTKLVYSQEVDAITQKQFNLNYRSIDIAANIEYLFIDEELEQVGASLMYPLNEQWTLVSKYQQSILEDKPIENLFGLSYESCCWGIKILASEVSDDSFETIDRAIYFELTLKGLAQTGRKIENHLTQAIPGYHARF